ALAPPSLPLETLFCGVTQDGSALAGPTSCEGASDGYADTIFRYAARVLHGVTLPPDAPIQYKAAGRAAGSGTTTSSSATASGCREAAVAVGGRPVLSVGLVYGFRAIRGLVASMRRGRCPYAYVEVMACPSGCVNGGGQVRPGTARVHAPPPTAAATTATTP